jgi:hypothetical protein
MKPGSAARPAPSLAALRRFAEETPPVEFCELCGKPVPERHRHLLDPGPRRLLCACDACAVLFGQGSRYKRVPRRILALPGFRMSEAQWESLLIPINMAFFYRNGARDEVVAMYPSPAGTTESLLPLETWTGLMLDNPVLAGIEADVEALLVNRLGARLGFPCAEYYLTPIDECYRLTGLIRIHWRGFSGGAEVWEELGRFFADLRTRAETPAEQSHA